MDTNHNWVQNYGNRDGLAAGPLPVMPCLVTLAKQLSQYQDHVQNSPTTADNADRDHIVILSSRGENMQEQRWLHYVLKIFY